MSYYKGDYQSYEKVRAELLRAQKKAYEAQKRQRTATEEFIRKNLHSADPGVQKMVSQRKRELETVGASLALPSF